MKKFKKIKTEGKKYMPIDKVNKHEKKKKRTRKY